LAINVFLYTMVKNELMVLSDSYFQFYWRGSEWKQKYISCRSGGPDFCIKSFTFWHQMAFYYVN